MRGKEAQQKKVETARKDRRMGVVVKSTAPASPPEPEPKDKK